MTILKTGIYRLNAQLPEKEKKIENNCISIALVDGPCTVSGASVAVQWQTGCKKLKLCDIFKF